MAGTSLHGRNAAVYLAANSGAGAIAINLALARSWKLTIDSELIEATQGFGNIWRTHILASTFWSGAATGNFDTTQTTPFDAANQPNLLIYGPIHLYLYPDRSTPARFYAGNAWPKLTVEVGLHQVARYTLEFTGDGALTQS